MKNGTLYSVVKHIPVTPLKPAYAIQMSSEKDGKGFCELNKHDISPIKENTNIHNRQGVTFSILLDKVINLM